MIGGRWSCCTSGAIGDVLVAKAWNSQLRAQHRPRQADRAAGAASTSTCGSARPRSCRTRRTCCTSIWRWWYDFGTGDMGNDGVHDIDIARWGLGVDDPSRHASRRSAASTSSTTTSSSPTRSTSSSSTTRRRQAAEAAAHLRAAHLVALRPGRLRERQRLLRHQGHDDPRQERRLAALRPAQRTARGNDRHVRTAARTTRTSSTASSSGARPTADIEIGHLSRVALPPGQHRHAPRPDAGLRPAGRADPRRRRSRPARPPHVPRRPLGRAEGGVRGSQNPERGTAPRPWR